MDHVFDSSKKLSYQLQRLKLCHDRAEQKPCSAFSPHLHAHLLVKLVNVAMPYTNCVSVWCDQIIPSYCSILKTCQFLQQKKCLLCRGHFLWNYYRMSATSPAPWNGGIVSFKVRVACPSNCGHLPKAAQVQRDCQRNKCVPWLHLDRPTFSPCI